MYSFENWKYEDLLEGLKRGQGVFLEGVQEVVTNTGERRMLVPLVQALGAAPYNRCIIYLIDASLRIFCRTRSRETEYQRLFPEMVRRLHTREMMI